MKVKVKQLISLAIKLITSFDIKVEITLATPLLSAIRNMPYIFSLLES